MSNMFIRTNSNIYEINEKEDIVMVDKETVGYYYIGESQIIKEEQVIAKTRNDEGVEELVDCFALYVDGQYRYSDSDLYAVESLAIKYDKPIEIYGVIFTKSRFNGKVGSKIICKHDINDEGYGYYQLLGGNNT